MQRIDEHTVEFTDTEAAAHLAHEQFLDAGLSVAEATEKIQAAFPDLDEEFFLFLMNDGVPTEVPLSTPLASPSYVGGGPDDVPIQRRSTAPIWRNG